MILLADQEGLTCCFASFIELSAELIGGTHRICAQEEARWRQSVQVSEKDFDRFRVMVVQLQNFG